MLERDEAPPEPGAGERMNELLARWLVRAYVQRYGRTEDTAKAATATKEAQIA